MELDCLIGRIVAMRFGRRKKIPADEEENDDRKIKGSGTQKGLCTLVAVFLCYKESKFLTT